MKTSNHLLRRLTAALLAAVLALSIALPEIGRAHV